MKINPTEISVVVQGPIIGAPCDHPEKQHTRRCLASIRRALPGAEIVLSTWKGACLDGLDFDLVVQSDDPGGAVFNPVRKIWNNVNRQIVGTRNGLQAATRPYAMKLRGDTLLENAGFLDYFGRHKARSDATYFEERVLNCSLYARRPQSWIQPVTFHPSDCFFFGRRSDLLMLWEIELSAEPELSQWFIFNERRNSPKSALDHIFGWFFKEALYRYTPEQHIWLSFLRKYAEFPCQDFLDVEPATVESSEKSLASNLMILSPRQLGIKFLAFEESRVEWAFALYSHSEWLRLYDKWCQPGVAPRMDWERVSKVLYLSSPIFLLDLCRTYLRQTSSYRMCEYYCSGALQLLINPCELFRKVRRTLGTPSA